MKRVVIIKADGVPHDMLDKFVHMRDPQTGKTALPWIKHVFYERGARLDNFYTRGISVSAPSWSLLDTGQHLQIKGNIEFDRYTLQSYNYLNPIEYYLNFALSKRVDIYGTEVLDDLNIPLLADSYNFENRYASPQLFHRGVRWMTFADGFRNRFTTRTPHELLDEYTIGWSGRDIISAQTEREIIERLNDPNINYFDYYMTEFDHLAHHNHDRLTHLTSLQTLDGVIGRIWTAIQHSPRADETAFILVSDHGINTDEGIYSQGYNLATLLGSRAGGGHHVVTKRLSLSEYSLKDVYPELWNANLDTNVASESFYLKNQSGVYPTALLDFDGNERASLHLRDGDLNVLHILLQQLKRKDLSPTLRRAATDAFFATIDRRRAQWQETIDDLKGELGALHRLIAQERALFAAQPSKFTQADLDAGRDQDARRINARAEMWNADERDYTNYTRTVSNLLALRRETFDPFALKIEDVIAPRATGDPNSIYQLQNYVVGLDANNLTLAADGKSLDMRRSFKRIDYFKLFTNIKVRNNVQSELSNHPIDFVAVRLPYESLPSLFGERVDCAIWIDGGENQALILARQDRGETLQLRYLPIANLTQDTDGKIHFARVPLRAKLPLQLFEDANLILPAGSTDRAAWLNAWHSDTEWLEATHKTIYSNAIIGLHEQLARHDIAQLSPDAQGLSSDARLIRRFRLRQRALVEADLLLLANNHWNFNLSGFNPGGNHGSFFRVSTHSVLMFAGGEQTNIPRGLAISAPYDSLSFVPTVLTLCGQVRDNRPAPALAQRGFRQFPGRIIREMMK